MKKPFNNIVRFVQICRCQAAGMPAGWLAASDHLRFAPLDHYVAFITHQSDQFFPSSII
jgi:hypothetical protein